MPDQELTALELERIIPLREAAHLNGSSEDTLRRHHPDKIIRLSPRRLGMRVKDALLINDGRRMTEREAATA